MTLLRSAARSASVVHSSVQQLAVALLLEQKCQTPRHALIKATHPLPGQILTAQRVSSWPNNSIRCISSSDSSTTSATGASSSSSSQSSQQILTAAKEPSIKQLRADIFEQHIGDGRRSGRKAILKPLKGRIIADWYFTLTGPKMHMFDDPLEEE